MNSTDTIVMDKLAMETRRLTSLNREEFTRMTTDNRENDRVVVTLLLPMERKGAETRKNPIVFKNALTAVKNHLGNVVGDENHRDQITMRLHQLDDLGDSFWQHQQNGLAMVITEELPVQAYLTPFSFPSFTHIGKQPYLSPLLRLASGMRPYVLLLDLNDLRLFRATQWSAEEVELAEIPRSLEEAMKYDDPEKSLQNRRVSASNLPGSGGGIMAFHGHGITGDETQRKRVQRFFEKVDAGLAKHFDDHEAPLVLFGPDDEIGIYRDVSDYPHLCEDDIRFNATNLGRDTLNGMMCEWIAKQDATTRSAELEKLAGRVGQGRGSMKIEEVVKAATDGRVATLFLKEGEYRYGINDRTEDLVVIHETWQPGDEELLGAAATAVAMAGGDVYYCQSDEEFPEGAVIAAVFRY